MRIEISSGSIGSGASVMEFQSGFENFLSSADSVISCFKAIKNETCNLSGGVSSLQTALDSIDSRIQKEETARESATDAREKTSSFLSLAQRVDSQVAHDVKKNRDEFYSVNAWAKPAPSTEEKKWYERAWDWLCKAGESIAVGLLTPWIIAYDAAKKLWNSALDYIKKNKLEVINWAVTILCIAGSIAIIALTGGASLLVIALVSAASAAIIAGARNVTSQYAINGSFDNFNWKSFVKDVLLSAVIGGATGALGASFGGLLTSGLSSTALGSALLNSSSAYLRVIAGTVIGSVSEVITGIVVRGVSHSIIGLVGGDFSINTISKEMIDFSSMLTDAAIGGAFGGITEYRQFKSDIAVRNYNEVNDPVNWAAERGYTVKSSKNGTLDYSGTDYILKSPDGREIIVNIKATGSRPKDFDAAWNAAMKEYGINKSTFDTVTWQHMDNYNVRTNTFSLQLVDTNAHRGIKHAGGCKQYEIFKGIKYK